MNEKFEIMTDEEAEILMSKLIKRVPTPLTCGIFHNRPFFSFSFQKYIQKENDGGISWEAKEIGLGTHSFIELTTKKGNEKKTICLPFCLINSYSRQFAKTVAQTTIDPKDGRLGSKPAEIIVMDSELMLKNKYMLKSKSFKFEVNMKALTLYMVIYPLFPEELVHLRLKSKYCPFCRGDFIREEQVWGQSIEIL